MTVTELKNRLIELEAMGYGDVPVVRYDSEWDNYYTTDTPEEDVEYIGDSEYFKPYIHLILLDEIDLSK